MAGTGPSRERRRRRQRIWAGAAVAAVLAGAAVAALVLPSSKAAANPAPGVANPAPAADVLGRPAPAGRLHLLAFLATRPDTADTPSRSQAVQLVSLLTQYGSTGLSAEIVDESGSDRGALVNTVYDWQLGDVRLAADPDRSLARRYGVSTVPAVLLVGEDGAVLTRWDSGVLTAEAAQAIAGRLGPPATGH